MEWINDPDLNHLDPLKRELFENAARTIAGKSKNAMAPVMMSLILGAQKKGISFSSEEISLILQVLKKGKSPQEQAQIDQTVLMIQKMTKK